MAGTDRSNTTEWSSDGPAIILVEPQMGENIGAAARAMWNFGLRDLRIVSPRDSWPNERAIAMASGATPVIDNARIFDSTAAAIADLHYVVATTARPREMIKTVYTPERACAVMRDKTGQGESVGILFGKERTGLENDDVVRANAIVSVPVNPAFASLNLGQCVLLLSYEWRRLTGDAEPQFESMGRTEPATSDDVDRMLVHLEEELDEAHFFFPEHKRASMQANLRNIFRRAPLTDQDVRTLRGVIRALSVKRKRS